MHRNQINAVPATELMPKRFPRGAGWWNRYVASRCCPYAPRHDHFSAGNRAETETVPVPSGGLGCLSRNVYYAPSPKIEVAPHRAES